MSESTVASHAPEAAATPSLPRRILDVFLSPVSLFSRFGPRAPWVDVMLITVVASAVLMALIPDAVWIGTFREQMANNPNVARMDPESMVGVQRVSAIVMTLVAPWIMLLVQGGILFGIFTMLMGGEAKFRQYLAVGAHAGLIGLVGQIVALPLILAQENVQAGITLGALVPDGEGFLPAFLGALNVFLVWQVVVLALGVTAINRRRSPLAAIEILLGIYLLVAVVIGLVAGR